MADDSIDLQFHDDVKTLTNRIKSDEDSRIYTNIYHNEVERRIKELGYIRFIDIIHDDNCDDYADEIISYVFEIYIKLKNFDYSLKDFIEYLISTNNNLPLILTKCQDALRLMNQLQSESEDSIF